MCSSIGASGLMFRQQAWKDPPGYGKENAYRAWYRNEEAPSQLSITSAEFADLDV